VVKKALLFVFRILIGVYIIMQAAFIVLMLLKPDNDKIKKIFHIQIIVFNILFILDVNISMLVTYFKYAGQPYISEQHYKNVVHVALVGTYWTVAMLGKFFTLVFANLTLVPLETDK
jgi:hypothetical protein